MSLVPESLWNIHGEACRRILEEEQSHPVLYGKNVTLTLRMGVGVREMVMGVEYPEGVVVQLKTKGTPPTVVHSAPFSYDPYNDYYTEVYKYGNPV